jgi:LytS/YehU family sensor histidine kinase
MFDVLVYISTLLAVYTMDTGLRYQDDATRTAQLEAEVARSELAVMTAQVQPQFVLSTLNAVRRLLPANPGKAEVVVSRLSEILRITLENVSSEEVRLIDELEFLRRFFEIEQQRHSGTVDFDTSGDGDLLDAYVPNLLLQDLAVAWVGHSDPTASVSIRADVARRDGRLFLRFEVTRQDSAPTVPDDAVVERAKRRLQRFAADDWELRVTRDKGSVAIDMTMPERFASHDEGHDSERFDGGSFARLG